MTLFVHRSQRVQQLVAWLGDHLAGAWPDDPFAAVPIVTGSRGMQRWLRHELATRFGGLARIDFVFPQAAFEGAAAWLLDGRAAGTAYWRERPATTGWSGEAFARAVHAGLRAELEARPDDDAFAAVRGYLGPLGSVVTNREVAFARAVSDVLGRIVRDRGATAERWLRGDPLPPDEREHAWLAATLRRAGEHAGTTAPCDRFAALARLRPATPGSASSAQELLVFGLSTLTPGDRRAIELLARHLDVRLFALSPSREWWAETSTRDERRAEYRRAATDEERLAVLERGRDDNPLLARCGLPSRDFQRWCEALDYEETVAVSTHGEADTHGEAEAGPSADDDPRADDSGARPTLLRALQGWIDRAEPAPSPRERPWADLADDGSLEIHACHGALRQCEALRDELVRRFAKNPSLEPRHVLVMTPDVATYAPLLSAVFARDDGAPSVPVLAADLGLRATNPVADALARVVALGTERVTATALVELLGLGPVRERFELDERDLEAVRSMVAGAQIRWAWDADDRARHDQPRSASHTILFGLERLALGMLAPTPDGFDVIDARAAGEVPLVPVDVATRESVERFGKLARACLAIRRAATSLATPGTRASWLERLVAALDALTEVGSAQAWMRLKVDETLVDLLGDPRAGTATALASNAATPDAAASNADSAEASAGRPTDDLSTPTIAPSELLFEPKAIARLVGGALELPIAGERPTSGAITVCALEPMRSVPFEIIAIVGLDDGAFPRPARHHAWDPFARPLRGEHDRRAVDRHLLLEALLCAREAVLLFGNGFEDKRPTPMPMSLVVMELLDLLAAGTGRDARTLRRDHPLQPWSDARFADPERAPFGPFWARARAARSFGARSAGLAATDPNAPLPQAERRRPIRTARSLAASLANGPRTLLRDRLGLVLSRRDEALLDREPIEHDALDAWSLRARALEALQMDQERSTLDVEAIERRLRAEGALAAPARGRHTIAEAASDAAQVVARCRAVPGEPRPTDVVATQIGDLTIAATIEERRVRDDGTEVALFVTPSAGPNSELALEAWITLLVARCAGTALREVVALGNTSELRLGAPTPESAAEALAALVAIAEEAHERVVPLLPHLSLAVVKHAAKHSPRDALDEAAKAWEERSRKVTRGDRFDPWVGAVYGDRTIDDWLEEADAFVALGRRVYGPMLASTIDAKGQGQADSAAQGGDS